MKSASYCARQRKFTNSIPNSEKITRSKNGKLMIKSICDECGAKKSQFIRNKENQGGSIDIHKLIGKLPRPKSGFTPSKYKNMGPYNPLEKQFEYDPNTVEVQKWHVKPFNKVDEIAAYHDICYDMGRSKNECSSVGLRRTNCPNT